MKLHEYQAKEIFSRYGLPIPSGYVCNNINELEIASLKIKSNIWALKCQVHAGGRGKVGGVKITNNKKDIKIFAKQWFDNIIRTNQTSTTGKKVKKILIEDADFNISHELYLSIMVDTANNSIIVIGSKKGGISIEETAKKKSDLIHKILLDPYIGLQEYQARNLSYKLNLSMQQTKKFTDILMNLSSMFFDLDLSLSEINPLIITNKDKFICLDSKIVVDNNSKFRQKNIFNIYDYNQDNSKETYASKYGLSYISLEGNIGCLVNGAGLAMATMDMIQLYGGKPANFLDIGGSIKKENIIKALKIILYDSKINAILINIFGGIVRCDLIAEGIVDILKETKVVIPIVVRLEGNNSDYGLKILSKSKINIISVSDLNNAARIVVAASQGKINHVNIN